MLNKTAFTTKTCGERSAIVYKQWAMLGILSCKCALDHVRIVHV